LPRLRPVAVAVLALMGAAAGCAPAPPPGGLRFVRGGVVVEGPLQEVDGVPLSDDRVLVPKAWSPGEPLAIGGRAGVAPRVPECLPLASVPLGDVSAAAAAGAPAPDTALAWSPDASRLAVGTALGEVLVVEGHRGEVLARRALSEAFVKHLAWSPDGAILYAGEQSPDATLWALDAATLQPRWSLRLADRVETSPLPVDGDVYGVYDLPAVTGLRRLPDGSLLVVASHGWTPRGGARQNRAQVLLVSAGGELVGRWPDAPADALFQHARVSAGGDRLAITVNRSAEGPAPAGLPVGGVQVLRLPALEPERALITEPLLPHFPQPYIWEALDLDEDRVLMGYGDGRVRVVGPGEADALWTAGAPVMAGDVPVHVSVGWGLLRGGAAIFSTSGTLIPWGAAAPELRPPSAHPAERSVTALRPDGAVAWSWSGGVEIQGLSVGDDGTTLVVGAGARQTDDRRDLFGAVLLDLSGPDRPGAARELSRCPTAAPAFFRHALSADGRLALIEHPWKAPDGQVLGDYRLTVLR